MLYSVAVCVLLFRDIIILCVIVGIKFNFIVEIDKYNHVGICFQIMTSRLIQTHSFLAMLADIIAVFFEIIFVNWVKKSD